MIRDSIGRASSLAQFVAAGLLALVGARFGAHGVLFAIRERAPTLPDVASTTSSSGAPKSSASAPPSASSAAPIKLGSSLRIPIVVSSRAPRAEVRIDGILVGNTPYLGEVSCKAGEKIQIEVTPQNGRAKTHEGTCALGTLRVESDPQ